MSNSGVEISEMEKGPSLFFTDAEMTITAEDPLPEGFDQLSIPDLDQVDTDLGDIEQKFNLALDYLQTDALGWQDAISAASFTLNTDLADAPQDVSDDVQSQIQPAQDGIDGAESSFVSEAYEDTPPWYQMPSADIPDEPPAGSGDNIPSTE